jgi:predicted nucleic acid-binding protein
MEQASMPDTNVLIDIATNDLNWYRWSADAVMAALATGPLVINPIIYAEMSPAYDRTEALDAELSDCVREDLPWDAAFLAGQAYKAYRLRGGPRSTPIGDFYIGAHALLRGTRSSPGIQGAIGRTSRT